MLFVPFFTGVVFATAGGDGLPSKPPTDVGMSAARLEKVDHVVERGMLAGGYPGAAVVVGRRGAAVFEKGFGRLSWASTAPAVSVDRTIYDLASLTKVVATTTGIMLLYDDGKLGLDDKVQKFIPTFTGGRKGDVTVRMLLEHRSGLPAGRDVWRTARTPVQARAQVIATSLHSKPNEYFNYSDLGADMLGFIVEAVSGQRMDLFLRERVYAPLGMNNTYFLPSPNLRERIAPTETHPPRGYALRGEVHDENAYALGGIAGHAGLFSTAADLSVFAQMMLNGGEYGGKRILADSTVTLFTNRVRTSSTRGLGWDTCSEKGDGTCGQYMATSAFGHTGFTGTSLWIDPDHDMFVVLLTNRVHDARARRPSIVIADVRADLADAAALAVIDDPDGTLEMPAAFRADRAVDWQKPVVTRKAPVKKKPVAKVTAKPAAKPVTQAGKPAATAAKPATAAPKTVTTGPVRPPATKAPPAPPAGKKPPG